MPGPDFIRILLRQASASGGRSTALNPLGWLFGMELSGLLIATGEHAPTWMTVLLAAFLSLTVLAYIGAYALFAVKNPEALRSERFTLSRMAIEKSTKGDSLAGFGAAEYPKLSEANGGSEAQEEES